ncbi:MAG: hypothetical protein U0893_13040 [Chloroflexota bacterium]
MLGRIVRRVLHRLIRGLVVHPVRLVILLVALVAGAALVVFQAGLPSLSLSLPSAPFRVGSSGAPTATENYMHGTETFNAELVWSSLSDEAQGRFKSRGGSVQRLQSDMDQAKQAGAQLEQVTYIGGQSFPDGTSMHFYTVLTRGPQPRSEAEPVPYIFTLDKSGKIVRIQ